MATVSTAALQTALERVKPGLARREIFEQSMCFSFIEGKVLTYNDEISISYPIDIPGVRGAIRAESLYEFLQRVNVAELEITADNAQITIVAGRAKAGIRLDARDLLPRQELGGTGGWAPIPNPQEFSMALKTCAPCCATNMSRPALTGIRVEGQNITAADGYQIVQCALSAPLPGAPFLLPMSSAKELISVPVDEIARSDGWVHFRAPDGTVLSSRLMQDKFPNIAPFLNVSGDAINFPESLREALRRALVFASGAASQGENFPFVTLKICAGMIEAASEDEHGWFCETIPMEHSGPPIEFRVGAVMLSDLLARATSCIVGEQYRIKFTGDHWEHVIATSPLAQQ